MRCSKPEPHARHTCVFEPSHSPVPIEWECEGVPPKDAREVMEKAVGGPIESK